MRQSEGGRGRGREREERAEGGTRAHSAIQPHRHKLTRRRRFKALWQAPLLLTCYASEIFHTPSPALKTYPSSTRHLPNPLPHPLPPPLPPCLPASPPLTSLRPSPSVRPSLSLTVIPFYAGSGALHGSQCHHGGKGPCLRHCEFIRPPARKHARTRTHTNKGMATMADKGPA